MNSLPLTRVRVGTRECVELQPHKWKGNSVSHYSFTLPNSPRKCNPDLLARGTFMATEGQMAVDDTGWQSCCAHPAVGARSAPAELCHLRVGAANAGCVTGAALHWAGRNSGVWNIFSCWGICTVEHKPTHTFPQLPQSKATLEWSFYPNYLTKCIQFILLK